MRFVALDRGWLDGHRRRVTGLLLGAVVLGVVLVIPAAGAARTGEPGSGATGAVVFASDLGVFVANADGTEMRLVAPGEVGDPVRSPDGRQIAFMRWQNTDWRVVVMHADGSGSHVIGSGYSPRWSPDGRRIAFAQIGGGLYIADRQGHLVRRLSPRAGDNYAWSPDGTKIAYLAGDDRSLLVTDIRTGASTTLTELPSVSSSGISWSPGGAEIAFASDSLEAVDMSGNVKKLVGRGWDPVWSPDGSRIAYLASTSHWPHDDHLFVVNRDGSGERDLSPLGFGDASACSVETQTVSWSADSTTLAFERCRFAGSDASDIWLIHRDGTDARQMTHAYPTGTSFSDPQLSQTAVSAAPVVATAPELHLRAGASTRLPSAVENLAADDEDAAIQALGHDSLGVIGIWHNHQGVSWIADSGCDLAYPDLAIMGAQAAWTCIDGETMPRTNVEAGTRSSGLIPVASVNGDDQQVGNLVGEDKLLVYNRWRQVGDGPITQRRLIQITAGGTARQLLPGPDAGRLLAIDRQRLVVLRPHGNVLVLTERGRISSTVGVGRRPVEAARLAETRLIIQRDGEIDVYDSKTAALQHRWPTAAGPAPTTLEDAEGDYAVYTSGIAVHLLQLSTGLDRILAIPHEAQPAHAQLTPDGFYYSYNQEDAGAAPGRLAFVPARELHS